MELKYKNWKDITINIFEKLMAVDNMEQTNDIDMDNINKNIAILSVLCDVDEDTISNLGINEFGNLVKQTSFLNDMPKVKIENKYTINGKKYEVNFNLRHMNMAQYIDFQTYIKEQNKYLKEIIACFLIPKGMKYGEGYNVSDVVSDIGNYMSIVDANSIFFFFTLSFRSLTKAMLSCLSRKMKKMMRKEKNKEMKKNITEAMEQIKMVQVLVENGVG